MLGGAGVIRLVPEEDVATGLGLAEGIETALAVMQRAGWSPVWAANSAGAMDRFPVLPGIESLTIFADADGAGIKAARGCCGGGLRPGVRPGYSRHRPAIGTTCCRTSGRPRNGRRARS
jgi:hypothetical protein